MDLGIKWDASTSVCEHIDEAGGDDDDKDNKVGVIFPLLYWQ